jgi:hypothetical protein
MTAQLTKAGLDPSRIVDRAAVLSGKRKRDDEDVDMEGGEGGEDSWMDVDGEEGDGTPAKRLKTNAGAVSKREPRANRALAGMRDQGVRVFCRSFVLAVLTVALNISKRTGLSSCGILANGHGICWPRQEREIARSKQKWSVLVRHCRVFRY